MNLLNYVVNVNAFYFRSGENFKSFPRTIEYDNNRCTFKDGFQYIVKKGGRAIRLFDMSDGTTTYRLRCEDDQWTLIGTRPA